MKNTNKLKIVKKLILVLIFFVCIAIVKLFIINNLSKNNNAINLSDFVKYEKEIDNTKKDYDYYYEITDEYNAIEDLENNYEKVDILSVSEFINTPPTIINSDQEFNEYKMKYQNFNLINENIWDEKSVIVDIYQNYDYVEDLKVTDIRINGNMVDIDIAVCEDEINYKSVSNSIPYVIICDKINADANIKINITKYAPKVHKVEIPVMPFLNYDQNKVE